MAKSIRSKWKRKCRAVKRERYGKKELERLKKTLGITDDVKQDPNVENLTETVNIVDVETVKKQQEPQQQQEQNEQNDNNQMDVDMKVRKFNLRTLRDQHGTYPVWVHQRKIKKQKTKERAAKKRNAKKNKRR